VLKGLATEVRTKGTDVVDLWRCLEVGFAAGITPDDFGGEISERSVNRIRSIFSLRDGIGLSNPKVDAAYPSVNRRGIIRDVIRGAHCVDSKSQRHVPAFGATLVGQDSTSHAN
jgi:hypothetical protein